MNEYQEMIEDAHEQIDRQEWLAVANKVPNEIKEALRKKYAWPGGYPLFLITSDGAALCIDCGRKEYKQIVYSTRHDIGDGWKVIAAEVNWEDSDLYCGHCSKLIESAYGENNE